MKNAAQLPTGKKPAPGDLAFVQGFVNTIDVESGRDSLATAEGAAAWLQRHGLLPADAAVSEDERRRAVAVREALRALLLANNGEPLDPRAVATLDRAAAAIPLHLRVTDRGRLELHPTPGRVDAALGELQAVVYRAMLDGSWPRLKACRSDTCQWAFYDASKNHSGTWCSMEVCGNRTKVRSHRERRASAAG